MENNPNSNTISGKRIKELLEMLKHNKPTMREVNEGIDVENFGSRLRKFIKSDKIIYVVLIGILVVGMISSFAIGMRLGEDLGQVRYVIQLTEEEINELNENL